MKLIFSKIFETSNKYFDRILRLPIINILAHMAVNVLKLNNKTHRIKNEFDTSDLKFHEIYNFRKSVCFSKNCVQKN